MTILMSCATKYRQLRYSTDLVQYSPRCLRCHSRHDAAVRAAAGATPEGAPVSGDGGTCPAFGFVALAPAG